MSPDDKHAVMHPVSVCLVNQAEGIAGKAERIKRLHGTVGDPQSLTLHQWVHFHALCMEYGPDLVIELGRGFGNSTVAFAEAFEGYQTSDGGRGRLLSLCDSRGWEARTLPRLRKLSFLGDDWFDRIDVKRVDIVDFAFAPEVMEAERILVLWDAHGIEVADVVLSRLMPLIANKRHLVLMHDISDSRYAGGAMQYQGLPFWRGQDAGWDGSAARLALGWVETTVEQVIPVIDFLTRNGLELQSADHRVHLDIVETPGLLERLSKIYPEDFFDPVNHWAYFSLNDGPGPYTYPAFASGRAGEASDWAEKAEDNRLGPPARDSRSFFPPPRHQILHDLARSKWGAHRSPVTYARVIVKLIMGRY